MAFLQRPAGGLAEVVEQVGAVDASRLGDGYGHLDADEMWAVDEALTTVLGLR